jgi:hypothetical protein
MPAPTVHLPETDSSITPSSKTLQDGDEHEKSD